MKKDEALAPFEFKSIPKEIENKYNKRVDYVGKNILFDELQEFMKNEDDSTCETKVKLINENENENGNINNGKEKDQQKAINSRKLNDNKMDNDKKGKRYFNQRNYHKNKFGIPLNVNYLNKIRNVNYVNIQEKILQNIQYQNYLNKIRMKIINKMNNNQKSLSKNENKLEGNSNNTQKDNVIKADSKNTNIDAFSYFKNNEGINEKDEFENYINNIDDILKNYKNKRNWKVVDNRNDSVSKFNNEELYIFLNTIISRNENNNYSISDLEKDFFFNPVEIHEKLKNIFQKK